MGGFGEDPIEAADIEFEGTSKAKAAARRLSKPTMQTDSSAGPAAAATE